MVWYMQCVIKQSRVYPTRSEQNPGKVGMQGVYARRGRRDKGGSKQNENHDGKEVENEEVRRKQRAKRTTERERQGGEIEERKEDGDQKRERRERETRQRKQRGKEGQGKSEREGKKRKERCIPSFSRSHAPTSPPNRRTTSRPLDPSILYPFNPSSPTGSRPTRDDADILVSLR